MKYSIKKNVKEEKRSERVGSVKGQGGEEFQLHFKKSQWCINVSRSRSAQCISCLDPENWLGGFVNQPIL